jgi:GT2 family glycosyltransferase
VRVTVVIITTRDRGDDLRRTLDRLAALPERPPVVVVDNGSPGGPPELPGVRVVGLDEDCGAAGRTAGVLAAETPYVAFCDDDSWWEPGSLARAADLLDAHPDVGLLAATVVLPGGRPDPTCEAMARSPLPRRPGLPGPRVLGFIACGAVVRRDAYLAAGGFHPRWEVGGEEQSLAADLADRGWDLVHVPELVAHHHPSGTRDRPGRRAVETRNDLWFAWLRRPAGTALRATFSELARAGHDPHRWAGVLRAAAGAPAVLRDRRPAGPRVEADLRLLG